MSGVRGGKPDPKNLGGYAVNPDDAINALRQFGRLSATDWWFHWRTDTSLGMLAYSLVFSKDVCELIP